MKDGQEAIYYLVADDADALKRSPQLEGFRARGVEVLLLSDHVDAFWPEALARFDDKPLRSVTQGAVDLSKFAGEAPDGAESPATVEALVTAPTCRCSGCCGGRDAAAAACRCWKSTRATR
jgi:molecular chaperone HtpG